MPEIVNIRNFLLSVRETGYRSFAHSIAELVDNSLQARATLISINTSAESGGTIVVIDDGIGMSQDALRSALQFGGSTRFNDRKGSGRFGMGLPTSSVSLAKRVDVYTWGIDGVLHAYLDIDELQESGTARLPEPVIVPKPSFIPATDHGTTIVLSACDRAGAQSELINMAQAKFELSRIFRFPIQRFLRLLVNGDELKPFDPLFLANGYKGATASQYGPVLEYRLPVGNANAFVRARFSELPVAAWRDLSNPEKQALGVSRGAGVSIVRNDREIAYGWYFLGSKRRENYDDWWRCEVSFPPELDEYFGVNHTKQQISPTAELNRLLTTDIENIARALNARVRQGFIHSAKPKRQEPARVVSGRDKFLPSLLSPENTALSNVNYRIALDPDMVDSAFYRATLNGQELVVYLNTHHPITPSYLEARTTDASQVKLFEYLLLAAARAELGATSAKARWWFRYFRTGWSDTLAAFLGN